MKLKSIPICNIYPYDFKECIISGYLCAHRKSSEFPVVHIFSWVKYESSVTVTSESPFLSGFVILRGKVKNLASMPLAKV